MGLFDFAGDVVGGLFGNYQQQKAISSSKKQIQTTVADAKKAGIHPLYAIGAGATGSSSFIPGQSPWGDAAASGFSALGEYLTEDSPAEKDLARRRKEQRERLDPINRTNAVDEANIRLLDSQTAINMQKLRSNQDAGGAAQALVEGSLPKGDIGKTPGTVPQRPNFNLPWFGQWTPEESHTPAEALSDWGGEPVEWLYSLGLISREMYLRMRKGSVRNRKALQHHFPVDRKKLERVERVFEREYD